MPNLYALKFFSCPPQKKKCDAGAATADSLQCTQKTFYLTKDVLSCVYIS